MTKSHNPEEKNVVCLHLGVRHPWEPNDARSDPWEPNDARSAPANLVRVMSMDSGVWRSLYVRPLDTVWTACVPNMGPGSPGSLQWQVQAWFVGWRKEYQNQWPLK